MALAVGAPPACRGGGHAGCQGTTRCAGAAVRPGRRRVPAAAARRGLTPSAGVPAVGPDLEFLRSAAPATLSQEELGKAVEEAFEETFWGALAAPRVLDSYRRLLAGREYERHWPGLGLQVANSYIKGLTAAPLPDIQAPGYEWLLAVEQQADAILREFREVTADAELAAKGNNIWVPAVRGDAAGYGDDWRTLVLQDRGHWDPDNARLFPRTVQVFQDLKAPTLEVFFARQPAGTGIKSHTDYVNFIQTSHLGLDIPAGDCWFKVGDHVRQWEQGRAVVWDTSFVHETFNGADRDRIVLIMRHWHPEVKPLERRAVGFLFDCLDAPSLEGIRAAQARAQARLGSVAHAGGKAAKATKGKGKKRGATGEWLGEDLGFQGIERELASLPGSYAAEAGGSMLLAYAASGSGEECIGAVALRRLAGHTPTLGEGDAVAGVPLAEVCEMKRLFVLEGHHGLGAGAALVRALLTAAPLLGYRLMVLDTLERLSGANRLYSRLGFQPCKRYNDCPLPGVLYFALQLGTAT
ncbi:hypothetical protein CHLNCDRAFT_58968 [Chlorella variabilis]|uniref:N-acetyltransferase domain-containing protein n=1 Tax=Chlorella variabilis TaxID=554065 RepID=E1ZPU5_CHLVA|nr:hypothetical protein CHLNCDRAFT_58968 [Chlorella variabilis]EFN52042.1 hypothetical protein CHLNCDRAFT_58968 [Chlorella variabilis]|eukprot:XP_005844144.1 hypothetical protein CHLNCDRAFT_58968 [Chlorella variabilis]